MNASDTVVNFVGQTVCYMLSCRVDFALCGVLGDLPEIGVMPF
jgi:hypothetical protein